ncbi:MAG: hypothetical protein V8R81_08000 [Clostridia bacterium]
METEKIVLTTGKGEVELPLEIREKQFELPNLLQLISILGLKKVSIGKEKFKWKIEGNIKLLKDFKPKELLNLNLSVICNKGEEIQIFTNNFEICFELNNFDEYGKSITRIDLQEKLEDQKEKIEKRNDLNQQGENKMKTVVQEKTKPEVLKKVESEKSSMQQPEPLKPKAEVKKVSKEEVSKAVSQIEKSISPVISMASIAKKFSEEAAKEAFIYLEEGDKVKEIYNGIYEIKKGKKFHFPEVENMVLDLTGTFRTKDLCSVWKKHPKDVIQAVVKKLEAEGKLKYLPSTVEYKVKREAK